MNLLLGLLSVYIPEKVKKKKIYELFRITAESFQSLMPEYNLKKITLEKFLQEYALFTKEKTEEYIKEYGTGGKELAALKSRLYGSSYMMGEEIRKNLKIKNPEEVLKTMRLIYKIIGIDFRLSKNREIVISRCFFSSYYDKGICCIISSLDEGLAAGVSGGAQLEFLQRITEGMDCCRALLTYENRR